MADDQPDPPDAVAIFAPWSTPDERKLRIRIHHARDVAVARASRSQHGNARVLYWMAANKASAVVFARASDGELREVLDFLTRQFLNAGCIERTEAPDD